MTVSYRFGQVTVHAAPPVAPEPWTPTGRPTVASEWRTAREFGRQLAHQPRLLAAPRGQGLPVILIPGWKTPESAMGPLLRYLRRRGHDARPWGLGVNRGQPERDALRLAEIVAGVASEREHPVALIGWSLGGIIAREVAREHPDLVDRVVTMGTPAFGGPGHTAGARVYGPEEVARISALTERLDREKPISVPITAYFTRRDAVVSWPACIDRSSPNVSHVEVRSTHAGLVFDPDVWRLTAGVLAERSRAAVFAA